MLFTKEIQKELISLTKFDEIELRLQCTSEQISQYETKFKLCDESRSLVMLGSGGRRRESFYNSKMVKISSTDIDKVTHVTVYINDAKLSIASELAITDFKMSELKSVRFKHRKSYEIASTTSPKLGRLDITRTMMITQTEAGQIIRERDQFFNSDAGKIEVEFEFAPTQIYGGELVVYLGRTIAQIFELLDIDISFKLELSDITNRMNIDSNKDTLKQVARNPIMLDRESFGHIKLGNYMVLEKSDGLRCMIKYYDSKNYTILREGIVSYISNGAEHAEEYTLFDCEAMKLDHAYEYHIFDVLIYNGVMMKDPYIDRIKLLFKMKLPSELRVKKIYPATCEYIKKLYNSPNIDGLIFNESRETYEAMKIYKWKPAELITFDFLIVPVPKSYQGISPLIAKNNLYILMTGCASKRLRDTGIKLFSKYRDLLGHYGIVIDQYNPVPFSTPLWAEAYIWDTSWVGETLCVGEFNLISSHWNLIKIREDKTQLISKRIYGNDYFVAQRHYNELQNPLTIDELCENRVGGGYFTYAKNMDYKNMAKFNAYVKYNIMKILRDVDSVLDIASGKGQDIFVYNGLGVRHVTFVEPDRDSVVELSSRVQKLHVSQFYTHTPMPQRHMKYEIINSSFEDFEKNMLLSQTGYSAIVCNFAIHYILTTPVAYQKFAAFCHRVGARVVILTCFDYEILSKYLPLKNEKYDVYEEGGKIYVKHHFSTSHYAEYPIKSNMLIREMSRHYELIARDSFGQFLKDYDIEKIDADYCSFYQYFVFRHY